MYVSNLRVAITEVDSKIKDEQKVKKTGETNQFIRERRMNKIIGDDKPEGF